MAKGPWIQLGDFNQTGYATERKGTTSSSTTSKEFNTIIDTLQ